MKRNLYWIFVLLSIFVACAPNSNKLDQSKIPEPIQTTPTMVETETWPTMVPIERPTPAPEIMFETDPNVEFDKLPVVSYEDFVSGKVLEAERKYLEMHNPFNGNEIWPTGFDINILNTPGSKVIKTKYGTPTFHKYYENPSLLPVKNVFRFRIYFPNGFFPKQDENHLFYNFDQNHLIIYGQVWLNPDSKSEDPADKYRILHYPFDIKSWFPPTTLEDNRVAVPFPVYSFDSNVNKDKGYGEQTERSIILKFYEENNILKYFKEWVKTNRIPIELENYILPGECIGFSKLF